MSGGFGILLTMADIASIRKLAALMLIGASVLAAPLFAGVQIGEKVRGFRLADAFGRIHTLDEYAGKIVVLEFWSFKCPVSAAYSDRVAALQSKYRGRGVVVLAIASNKNESPVEVKRNAENLALPFPVLLDQDGSLAEMLGVTHTPSVGILDGAGMLRYRGAIDNNKQPGERGRSAFAEEALDAMLAGRAVSQAETKPFGCSIKR